MLVTLVEHGGAFVASYGLLALLVVFVLEGAFVGRILPTRALLVVAVVLFDGSIWTLLSVLAIATAGATAGQYLVFVLVRRNRDGTAASSPSIPFAGRLPAVPTNTRWMDRTQSWFDRWGLPALLVSNALPVGRGYLAIPVAFSDVPGYKFVPVSAAGTLVYVSTMVALAVGVDTAIEVTDTSVAVFGHVL